MELEKIIQCANSYGEATARTLFAIDSANRSLLGRQQNKLAEMKKNHEKECAILRNRIANELSVNGLQLNKNLSSLDNSTENVLSVCEYLEFGKISIPEMVSLESSLKELPFIVPMIGHGNLVLLHNSDDTRSILTDIVWRVISATAPGQLEIVTYNPHLRNQLSFLSNVEQFSTIISADELQALLDSVSQEILHVDSMLKGSYESLVELRKVSQQPVGTLRLIVLQDTDFISDERLLAKFLQVISNCTRAGVCFIISDSIDSRNIQQIKQIPTLSFINAVDKHTIYSEVFSASVSLPVLTSDISNDVQVYIQKASESSVITIPFSEIEDTEHCWSNSTKHGITFSMGRSGLDTITLTLGDSKTQLHNVLISGAVGKGKSNLLEVIIHSMCTRYSPDEVELYLLDFKDGLTFKPYSDAKDGSYLPHARVLGLESERDIGLATLQYIESLREERAKVFKAAGDFKGIGSFREHNPDVRMPRIVLMIDEYQKLFEKADNIGMEAASVLENIVRQGRAFGIHVILASQTITGAAALLGRTDNIYAQFPIRIALQNSLNESYATFVQGNDGAAKLRVRGEAILNCNYGEINSNQRFTVAYAEPGAMRSLRKSWYQRIQKDYTPPIVFRKNEEFHFTDLIGVIKGWRKLITEGQAVPMVPCGVALSVNREQISVRMSNDSGRNIAILGSGEDAQGTEPLSNDAIGLIQSIGLALSLQHVDGNARFSLVNGLDKAVFEKNGMSDWLSLMERIGYCVDVVEKENVSSFFQNIASQVTNPDFRDNESHYILCLALDRCTDLSLAASAPEEATNGNLFFTPVAEKGVDSFQKVLQFGSAHGTHIISWWSNATIYKDHIGYQGDGFVNTKILLRVDNNTAQSILGMFTAWGVQPNRALIHDNSDLEDNRIVVPYKPMSKRECGRVLSEDWNI